MQTDGTARHKGGRHGLALSHLGWTSRSGLGLFPQTIRWVHPALPTLVTVVALGASLGLLALSLRSLPLGSAYAIWTGIGAVGAFGVGVLLFGEALTPMRVCAALMILGGIVLMKLSTRRDGAQGV